MISPLDLQNAVVDMLAAPDVLSVPLKPLAILQKDMAHEIEAAAQIKEGLCIFVAPPLPTAAMQDVPSVFFTSVELRVSLIEIPSLNTHDVDAFSLVYEVSQALHWRPRDSNDTAALALGAMLAHPLQLATRPTELIWDPSTRLGRIEVGNCRMIDVIFEAVFGVTD